MYISSVISRIVPSAFASRMKLLTAVNLIARLPFLFFPFLSVYPPSAPAPHPLPLLTCVACLEATNSGIIYTTNDVVGIIITITCC
jgi:hypothetical protein